MIIPGMSLRYPIPAARHRADPDRAALTGQMRIEFGGHLVNVMHQLAGVPNKDLA